MEVYVILAIISHDSLSREFRTSVIGWKSGRVRQYRLGDKERI